MAPPPPRAGSDVSPVSMPLLIPPVGGRQIRSASIPAPFIQRHHVLDSHCLDYPQSPWGLLEETQPDEVADVEMEESLLPSRRGRSRHILKVLEGQSAVAAIFNSANTVLGSGILALPFAMQSSGLLLGFSLLLATFTTSIIGLNFLVTSSEALGPISVYNSYERLAYVTMGLRGVFVATFAFVIGGFGLLMANLIFASQCFLACVMNGPVITSRQLQLTIIFFGACLVFPLCLFKSITKLRFASLFSIFMVAYIGIYVTVKQIVASTSGQLPAPVSWTIPPHHDIPTTTAILISAFSSHVTALPVYEKMRNRTITKARKVWVASLTLAFCLYLAVAWSGVRLFGNEADPNILNNFWTKPLHRGWSLRLAAFAAGFNLLTTMPLLLWPVRSCLIYLARFRRDAFPLCADVMRPSRLEWIAWTFLIVGSVTLVATLKPNVKLAFRIVGSIAGALICFILPSLFFILSRPPHSSRLSKVPAVCLLLLGILVGSLSFHAALVGR